jgi:hypothetical protein
LQPIRRPGTEHARTDDGGIIVFMRHSFFGKIQCRYRARRRSDYNEDALQMLFGKVQESIRYAHVSL